jgi:hypothetical protein
VLLPELHLSFLPEEVKRKDRRAAEMKVYNLPAVPSGAVYEGLVWGSYEKDGGRFPVAIVELTFT